MSEALSFRGPHAGHCWHGQPPNGGPLSPRRCRRPPRRAPERRREAAGASPESLSLSRGSLVSSWRLGPDNPMEFDVRLAAFHCRWFHGLSSLTGLLSCRRAGGPRRLCSLASRSCKISRSARSRPWIRFRRRPSSGARAVVHPPGWSLLSLWVPCALPGREGLLLRMVGETDLPWRSLFDRLGGRHGAWGRGKSRFANSPAGGFGVARAPRCPPDA